MTDHKKFGFNAVLEKPYKLEKLQQVIRTSSPRNRPDSARGPRSTHRIASGSIPIARHHSA